MLVSVLYQIKSSDNITFHNKYLSPVNMCANHPARRS